MLGSSIVSAVQKTARAGTYWSRSGDAPIWQDSIHSLDVWAIVGSSTSSMSFFHEATFAGSIAFPS